jgi:hypothetical protein
VFTTRTDRLLTILSFAVCVLIVLAIVGAVFSLIGPVELLIALVIALPLTVFMSRLLRSHAATTRPDGSGRQRPRVPPTGWRRARAVTRAGGSPRRPRSR